MAPKAYWEGQEPSSEFPIFNEETFYEKYKDLLQEPMYSLKSSKAIVQGLTYKKINDWDNANILQFSREKKEGWRKFSFVDIVRIHVITELRRFGFELSTIQHLFMALDSLDFVDDNSIEKAICNCLDGSKVVMLIENQDYFNFISETEIMNLLLPLNLNSDPFLILPFFKYVRMIASKDFPIDPNTSLSKIILADKEQYILELIKNETYEELTIKKNDGKEYTIKAKTRKTGSLSIHDVANAIASREYQNIRISQVKGKIISIVREETLKI